MKTEYILYIIVRNDLPSLNAGKAMAQASHASNAFIKKYGDTKEAKMWANSTNQGFGTVIVLSANLNQLTEIQSELPSKNVYHAEISDPSYPYVVNREIAMLIDKKHHTVEPIEKNDGTFVLHRKEITCAYVFGTKENCKYLIGHLPLHP